MPSIGGKAKLRALALAVAILAVTASTASANPAWVWACHGPNGQSIATAMGTGGGLDYQSGSNCAAGAAGATLSLVGPNPAATSHADLSIELPPGASASKVVIVHTAHGSATGARYTVSLGGSTILDQPLDAPVATLPSEFTASGSGTLKFSLTCNPGSACAQGATPVSVDIAKVSVLVDDTRAPYGGVNRNSPTNRFTELIASAIEEGVGFSRAVVTIATAPTDAAAVRSKTVAIGSCDELSPGDATIDLPLDTERCKTGSQEAKFKTAVVKNADGSETVLEGTSLDTSALPAGTYYRRVTVYDAAGNGQDLLHNGDSVYEPFEIWHPDPGSSTQTLSIGSSSTSEQPSQNPSTQPSGGTQGNQPGTCRSPRLSVSLGQKPLRVGKHVVVLQYGKRYRFQGRLTCVVNGKRISAPKRTKITLLNKVGKKTVTKTGPRLADKGRFKISLKYPRGSRTLIFRFTSPSGQRSQVSIKIKVEKKKKSKR